MKYIGDVFNADDSLLSYFTIIITFCNATSIFFQYLRLVLSIRSYQKNDGRFIKKDYNI